MDSSNKEKNLNIYNFCYSLQIIDTRWSFYKIFCNLWLFSPIEAFNFGIKVIHWTINHVEFSQEISYRSSHSDIAAES